MIFDDNETQIVLERSPIKLEEANDGGYYFYGGITTVSMETAVVGVTSSVTVETLKLRLEMTRFVVQKVLVPAFVAFGFLGNVVNMAVLTRRWMKSSTNCYLTALALYDVLYLALAFFLSLGHYEQIKTADWYNWIMKPFVRPLTDTCSNTGVWLTLTFTIERYIGVCHPMKGKVWCTPKRAKIIIFFVCLSAAVITFPEFFEFTASMEFNPARNRTILTVTETHLGRLPAYAVGYKYANQALFTFLPLVLLAVFNSLLVNAVISAARWRQRMSASGEGVGSGGSGSSNNETRNKGGGGGGHQGQNQQRITVMLITVVVVFLVCQTPQAVQHVYFACLLMANTVDQEKILLLRMTANVFNLLVIANCCSNFVLYSSFSSRFRMTFRKLFCGPCATRKSRTTMEALYSDAAVSTPHLPLIAARRKTDGKIDAIVCRELWQNSDTQTIRHHHVTGNDQLVVNGGGGVTNKVTCFGGDGGHQRVTIVQSKSTSEKQPMFV